MKIVPNSRRLNYPFDPALNFGFESLGLNLGFTLAMSVTDPSFFSQLKGPVVYFDLEEPNKWWTRLKPETQANRSFEWTLTIDPHSAEFFRSMNGRPGESCFIPTNPDLVPPPSNMKKYDVVYTGHLVSRDLVELLNRLSKQFSVAVVSNSNHRLVTHRNLSYADKLRVVADARLALVHNTLWVQKSEFVQLRANLPKWRMHGSFRHLRRWERAVQLVPQLKSRIFEAAFCATVPVVISDKWNVWRSFFDSEEVVQTGSHEAVQTIAHELDNPQNLHERGRHLRDKSFEKYTTRAFAEKYLLPLAL